MMNVLSKKILFLLILLSFCISLMGVSWAAEELWKPEGPVDLILSSKPGGGHDVVARILAKLCEEIAGVRLNIINMPEGGGVVALTTVMDARPDGYTMGQMGSGIVTNQYALEGIRYNPSTY